MKQGKQSSTIVNIVGGIALVALLFFGGISLLSGPKIQNQITGNVVSAAPPESSATATVVNGVQEVTLGWGKLNYAPEFITVKKGMPVRLTADVKRLSGCFRSLNIPELGVSKQFTESDTVLEFTPQKTGTFTFSCAMGMGSGKLQVV